MAGFVADHGVEGFEHVADVLGQVWTVFGVNAQPSYVFINDDGTIRRHVGGMQPEDLERQITRLIAE